MRIVEKLMRKRDQSERINCQQNCCHSFNDVIDQASIRFSITHKVYTALCDFDHFSALTSS